MIEPVVVLLGFMSIMAQMHNYGIDPKDPNLKDIRVRRSIDTSHYKNIIKEEITKSHLTTDKIRKKRNWNIFSKKQKIILTDETMFNNNIQDNGYDYRPNGAYNQTFHNHNRTNGYYNQNNGPRNDIYATTPNPTIYNNGWNGYEYRNDGYGQNNAYNASNNEYNGVASNRNNTYDGNIFNIRYNNSQYNGPNAYNINVPYNKNFSSNTNNYTKVSFLNPNVQNNGRNGFYNQNNGSFNQYYPAYRPQINNGQAANNFYYRNGYVPYNPNNPYYNNGPNGTVSDYYNTNNEYNKPNGTFSNTHNGPNGTVPFYYNTNNGYKKSNGTFFKGNNAYNATNGTVTTTPKIVGAWIIGSVGCANFMKYIPLLGCVPEENIKTNDDYDYGDKK